MKTILILILVLSLIIISFRLAKKKALTCTKCKSRNCKKTGKQKEIERNRKPLISAVPSFIEYEYKCENCKYRFWSTIESVWE